MNSEYMQGAYSDDAGSLPRVRGLSCLKIYLLDSYSSSARSGSDTKELMMLGGHKKITGTIKSFFDSYQAAFDTKDATKLSATLTPGCLRTMQPPTLAHALGLQHDPISVAEYEAIAQLDLSALEVGHIEPMFLDVNIYTKSAICKVKIITQLKDGTKYNLEFTFLLSFTDSCDKINFIAHCTDIADTAAINGMIGRVNEIVRLGQEKGTCTTVGLGLAQAWARSSVRSHIAPTYTTPS